VSLPWGGQPRYPPNYTPIRIVGSSVLFEFRNLVPRKRVNEVIKKEIIKENNNMLISDYTKNLGLTIYLVMPGKKSKYGQSEKCSIIAICTEFLI
jgi:hypothetical protein